MRFATLLGSQMSHALYNKFILKLQLFFKWYDNNGWYKMKILLIQLQKYVYVLLAKRI